MKKVALLFFILGMITYLYIPKDVVLVATTNMVPEAKAIYYDEAGKNCVIFNTNPTQEAVCKK